MDKKIKPAYFVFIGWLLFFFVAHGHAEPVSDMGISLLSPGERTEIIAKKPIIQFGISVPFQPENLLVLLDSADITGLVTFIDNRFEVKPVIILPPGEHQLMICVETLEGKAIEKKYSFTTRHSKAFEEVYTENEMFAVYEGVLSKNEDSESIPDSKIEAGFASSSKLSSKGWSFSMDMNARYLDQNLHVNPPQKKGADLVNHLLTANYQDNKFRLSAETGKVTINESPNTLSALSREGNRFSVGYDGFKFSSFMVTGQESYGFNNDFYRPDHSAYRIMGVSGENSFFSDRLFIKTLYISGDEPGEAFGSWYSGGDKKGSVYGLAASSSLFEKKLQLDAEFDVSDYDNDQADEFFSTKDKAYRLNSRYALGQYAFDIRYSYVGPDYSVIGNPSIPKDREGITLQTGADFKEHTVNLSAARSNDNVENDDLFPRITFDQYGVDYGFNKYPSLPLRLSYGKTMMKSSLEPVMTSPLIIETDTVSGQLNYIKTQWNLGLQTSYSLQSDLINPKNGTTSLAMALNTTFSKPHFSISPSLSFIQSGYRLSDVKTDTFGANLDMKSELLENRLAWEFSGALNQTKADDQSVDMYSYNANTRLSYAIRQTFWRLLNLRVALIGRHCKTKDSVSNSETHETACMVVLVNNLMFSL